MFVSRFWELRYYMILLELLFFDSAGLTKLSTTATYMSLEQINFIFESMLLILQIMFLKYKI